MKLGGNFEGKWEIANGIAKIQRPLDRKEGGSEQLFLISAKLHGVNQ